MRRRIALVVWPSLLAGALLACPARADTCSGLYSPCINDDTLWPHAGPSRFVAVGSAETVAPGQIGFGLVTTYLSRPILLHVSSPGASGSDQYAVNDQVNGTFLWSYGVTDRLELDLAMPLTFGQGGTGLAPLTGGDSLKDTAVRDMRFGFAYALVPHARIAPDLPTSSRAARSNVWGLVGRLEVSAPTGDRDEFAGERSGVFAPSLAGDWRHGRWYAGLELGARLRPTTELLGARIGTQLFTSAGIGFDVLPRELLSAQLEAWALPTLEEQQDVTEAQGGSILMVMPNGSYIVPAEWQLSARTAPLPGGDLSFVLGGGGGIPITPDAITTPRWRFTLGVSWAPLARDSDGDGLPDAVDKCPSIPARGSKDGCPPAAPAQPATAAVDLHLATARDVCTAEPDLVDGFRDDDGCPDEDQDHDGVPDRMDKCPLVPEDYAGLTDGCPDKK